MWETNHPIVRLKEILRPVRRVIRPQAGETYRLLGVKWYGEGCRIQGEYSGDTLQTPSLSQVQVGDIVYNKMWTSKGSFASVTDEFAGAWTTSEFPAFTPVDGVYSDYLAYVFRQPRFWALAKAWSVGTTERSRLNPSEFLRMPVPLPCTLLSQVNLFELA